MTIHSNAWPFAGQDIRTLLRAQRAARPDKIFLTWVPFEGDAVYWTYERLIARIEGFAAGLHARGVRPAERVLVHLENCPEAIIAWLGCAVAGAVAVTTNTKSSGAELAYFAAHSGAVAGITQPKFAELVGGCCPELRFVGVTATDCGEAPASAPAAAARFEAIDGDPSNLPRRPENPASPFGVQYTSGTTSRPKAVLWTHANALWGARISAAHEDLRADDVHLVTMPLYHTNAQAYSVLASLWAGASIVLQPRFSASRFWQTALTHGCSWTSIVPFFMKALLAQEVPTQHKFRLWGNAYGAPPEDSVFHTSTIGWWGMTETITHGIVGLPHLPNAPFSMGRAAPEYTVRLLNEKLEPACPGETGDLAIRGVPGLSLFAEYLDDAAATAGAFDQDGFLLTGDRAFQDEAGNFYFADRAKDMLKVGGENVSAAEIERIILLVPGVREVAVVARKHAMLDEVPVAFLLAADGEDVTLADRVAAACAESLASFKQPREIRVLADFPRATLEKVAKAKLRQMLAEESVDRK